MSVLPVIFDFPLSLVVLVGAGVEGDEGREAGPGTSKFEEDFCEVFFTLGSFFSLFFGGSEIVGGGDFAVSDFVADFSEGVDFEGSAVTDFVESDVEDFGGADFDGSGVADADGGE